MKQRTLGADRELSGLGERFFKKNVGVRVHMLGEEGTLGYIADTPVISGAHDRIAHGAEEPAGVTVAAARNKPSTTFVAVHEMFEGGPGLRVTKLAEADDAVGVILTRPEGSADVVLLRWGAGADEPVTLEGEGFAFRFTGYGFVRFNAAGQAVATEGKVETASMEAPPAQAFPPAQWHDGPLAARWSQEVLRLPQGRPRHGAADA